MSRGGSGRLGPAMWPRIFLDQVQQLFGPPWLREVVGFHGKADRRPGGRAGRYEQRNPWPSRVDREGGFKPFFHAFQPHIREDSGGLLRVFAQEGECLGGGGEAADIETGTSQKIECVFAH